MKKVVYTILLFCVACTSNSTEEEPSPTNPTEKKLFNVPSNFPKPVYTSEEFPITEAGFALGRTLFYDGRLSRDGTISCGECHRQEYAFTHHQHDVSHGIDNQLGERNAPSLQNMAWQKEFFWDGNVHSLDLVPINAIESPVEMGETMTNVLEKLRKIEKYPPLFEKAYGSKEITNERFLNALRQFVLTLTSSNSKYDKVMRNEGATFTADEAAGFELFKQKCQSCHAGELFTDQSYRNNGLAIDVTREVVVNGKIETKRFYDEGRYRVTKQEKDRFKFKVPSLRNVGVTRPYMHDGRFWILEDVLDHYTERMTDNGIVDEVLKTEGKAGLKLSHDEKLKIIAFLHTLTDRNLLLDPKFSEQ